MKQGIELPDLFAQIQMYNLAKKDIRVDAKQVIAMGGAQVITMGPTHGELWIGIPTKDGGVFKPNRHMMNQIRADLNTENKFDLRAGYWDACAESTLDRGIVMEYEPHENQRIKWEERNLLAINMNHWLRQSEKRKMVRTYDFKGDGDNVGRAWLSSGFHRIDYEEMMQMMLPMMMEMYEQGRLQFVSCEITETKLYMKVIVPALRKNIKLANYDDIVDFGFVLGTSEVGASEFFCHVFSDRARCRNGMIHTTYGKRRRHIGKRIKEEDEYLFSEEAIRADDHAFWLIMRDELGNMLEGVYCRDIVSKIEEASGIVVAHAGAAVEVLKNKCNLTQLKADSILFYFTQGSDPAGNTLYGLINAVTRAAEDIESYDEATDMEALGGAMMEWSQREIREVVEAKAK